MFSSLDIMPGRLNWCLPSLRFEFHPGLSVGRAFENVVFNCF